MAISEDISKNQVTLIVIEKSNYIAKSLEIIKGVEQISNKICYVALNKPYNSIIINLNNQGVNSSKFFFIDVLTATVQTPPVVDNCIFVESPNAITDISLAFTSALIEKGCDMALFDSISTLMIHQDEASVIKLSQNMMTKVRVANKKAVFITLKEDSETLIKDLTMFVDNIINL
jgi:hypothetical protein